MSRDWREEVVNWQDAWRNPDVLSSDSELSDTEDESESRYDRDGRRIRRWKKRPLGRFGLPIRHDTQDKVAVHVRHLYREAKIIRKGLQAARQERRRTGVNKLSSIMKLDPAVLWFVCTRGCRHRLFRVVFHESIQWEDSNISWCCDNCASGEHMPSMISIPRWQNVFKKFMSLLISRIVCMNTYSLAAIHVVLRYSVVFDFQCLCFRSYVCRMYHPCDLLSNCVAADTFPEKSLVFSKRASADQDCDRFVSKTIELGRMILTASVISVYIKMNSSSFDVIVISEYILNKINNIII